VVSTENALKIAHALVILVDNTRINQPAPGTDSGHKKGEKQGYISENGRNNDLILGHNTPRYSFYTRSE
jgi:hypothetical protein